MRYGYARAPFGRLTDALSAPAPGAVAQRVRRSAYPATLLRAPSRDDRYAAWTWITDPDGWSVRGLS
jgi:hypothetical protein